MFTETLILKNTPYPLEAAIILCGNDINITIGGGDKKHIGAVALAVPRKSLKDPADISATASVLCLSEHKEDDLAKKAALDIAKTFNTVTVITVGIHIDNITPDVIVAIENDFFILIDRIKALIKEKISIPI